MCLLLQEDADVQVSDKDKFKEVIDQRKNISDVFQMNPGKDKVIFSPEHPYFDVAKKDKEYAANNFNMPIPPVTVDGGREPFKPMDSIADVEHYAKKQLGCEYANFKGLGLDVSNSIVDEIGKIKQVFPEIDISGVGSYQKVNSLLKDEVLSFYKNSEYYKTDVEKNGVAYAEAMAKSYIRSQVANIPKDAMAVSLDAGTIKLRGTSLNLEKYNGIYFNEMHGKDIAKINKDVIMSQEMGWFTKPAKDFTYVIRHELGHRIDKLIDFEKSNLFADVSAKFSKKEIAEGLSTYGATKRVEMIAESWAEYTSTETPRPIAKEIGDKMIELYSKKFK